MVNRNWSNAPDAFLFLEVEMWSDHVRAVRVSAVRIHLP